MYHFNNNFTGDTIMKIISIWILYILAWVINLTTSQFLDTLQIIKELIAILGFIIAVIYTLYRFKRDWIGWWPNKNKPKK